VRGKISESCPKKGKSSAEYTEKWLLLLWPRKEARKFIVLMRSPLHSPHLTKAQKLYDLNQPR
jgi:hypothetical protein